MSFIGKLVALGERQLEQEKKAAELITSTLKRENIPFEVHTFETSVPRFISASLTLDGEEIDCAATSFVSGEITSADTVTSSLISSQLLSDVPNINFNPRCASISRGNHYFAPSLAVRASDVGRILSAKDVRGRVDVERVDTTSQNILVGNLEQPKTVLICHYDSVGPGATDNASGTAMLMRIIIERPDLLDENLFVIGGNEELSYDYPLYWGRGYREFERAYREVLPGAKQILVVDCVGDAPVTFDGNVATIRLGFPVTQLESLAPKTALVYGSWGTLMKVYQSDIDVPQVLSRQYLDETYQAVVDRIEEKLL